MVEPHDELVRNTNCGILRYLKLMLDLNCRFQYLPPHTYNVTNVDPVGWFMVRWFMLGWIVIGWFMVGRHRS